MLHMQEIFNESSWECGKPRTETVGEQRFCQHGPIRWTRSKSKKWTCRGLKFAPPLGRAWVVSFCTPTAYQKKRRSNN